MLRFAGTEHSLHEKLGRSGGLLTVILRNYWKLSHVRQVLSDLSQDQLGDAAGKVKALKRYMLQVAASHWAKL